MDLFIPFGVSHLKDTMVSYPTNSKQIEPQIMRKFVQQQQIQNIQMPKEYTTLSKSIMSENRWTGSLLESSTPSPSTLQLHSLSRCNNVIGICDFTLSKDTQIDIIPPIQEYVLTCDEIDNLKEMYAMLYPSLEIIYLRRVCCKVHKISLCGEILSSVRANSYRNSCVSAYWKSAKEQDSQPELRIGHIQYMLRHIMTTADGEKEHIIALVHWFKKHPEEMYFGSCANVVRTEKETGRSLCYIPIQRLASRMCFGNVTINTSSGSENVIVTIPIPFKFYI